MQTQVQLTSRLLCDSGYNNNNKSLGCFLREENINLLAYFKYAALFQ